MFKYNPFYLLTLFLLFSLNSCMNDELWKDSHKPNLSVEEVINGGVIILNEGNFMYGNASLSYYDPKSGKLINDVFYRQNGIPLGDVAESAEVFDGELYIVLNNSGKVVAVNLGKYPGLKAFDFTHKITGLISPRYIYFIDQSKAYISDLYARQIYIIDPVKYQVKNSLSVDNHNPEFYQHPTEQMIPYGEYFFTNCYSFDNKILLINSKTDKVIDSIEVLAQPNSMVMDKYDKLWVICDGGYEGSSYQNTSAGLVRIDPETRTVEKIFIFNNDHWPSELTINGRKDTLYYINQDIWRMPVTASVLPDKPFVLATDKTGTKLFYSLGVNPRNSEVYAGDAIDHVQNGMVYRFLPDSTPIDTIRVGIIPGFFYFL